MSCLTFFNGLCLSECVHVVEGAELYLEEAFFIQSGISHSVPELPRPAALLCVPGEAPLFMAKSWLHFRQRSQGLAKCDCEGNIENSNTRLTWSTAGSVTAGADTSPAWRNVVFLPAVRNSHRLMMKLPMCEKWLISASSLRFSRSNNYVSVTVSVYRESFCFIIPFNEMFCFYDHTGIKTIICGPTNQ